MRRVRRDVMADKAERKALVTRGEDMHYFVPNMLGIISTPFYWGKIDRYEAEALLNDAVDGSFLLRDSAQDDFIFSVSFRRYNRTLHARVEEKQHMFSFDCHDPGVFKSSNVLTLLKYFS